MKKEKTVKKKMITSPTHVLKLLKRVGLEMSSGQFDANIRKVIRDGLTQFPALLDRMDQQDEEYQNTSEVRIPALKKELKDNDTLLKKNYENPDEQIQIGLCQKGLQPGSPPYKQLIEKFKLDIEDAKIKFDSGIETINPVFKFQTNARWVSIQMEYHKQNINAVEKTLKEMDERVVEVKTDIEVQTQRMKLRRVQIIGELKELKVDILEYTSKTPDYIG